MFILGQFLFAAGKVIDVALNILAWLIIIRALISWVNPDPYNVIVQFLYKVTEPILNRLRAVFRLHAVGIDISPLIAILAIMFLRWFIVPIIYRIAANLM